MRLARELASRIVALRYEDLPPEAIYGSRIGVVDTIGVMLAGSSEAAPKIVEDVLGLQSAQGPSLIFGTRRRAACLDAARINGTAAHLIASVETLASVRELTALLEPAARAKISSIVHT